MVLEVRVRKFINGQFIFITVLLSPKIQYIMEFLLHKTLIDFLASQTPLSINNDKNRQSISLLS